MVIILVPNSEKWSHFYKSNIEGLKMNATFISCHPVAAMPKAIQQVCVSRGDRMSLTKRLAFSISLLVFLFGYGETREERR